tara:strand:+ start:1757 stop:2023 length:267 start_codon:yes stop_codon:yes gene_type:complete
MVNIETPEMNDEDREAAVEIMVDYRRGLRNLKTASLALHQKTGILPEFGEIILQNMKRDNVTQIRGYSKEPERMRKGKEGKPNEVKRT